MAAALAICCTFTFACLLVATGISSAVGASSSESRLGLCPAEAYRGEDLAGNPATGRNCSRACAVDTDCGPESKCCQDDACGKTCTAPVYACLHNDLIYLEGEQATDPYGCNRCTCSNGYLLCMKAHCEPSVDKTRILSLCLIGLGSACILGATLSLMKYHCSKRSLQDKNKNRLDTLSMMADV